MSSNDSTRQSNRPSGWLLVILIGAVVVVQLALGLAILFGGSATMETRGQFGDLFGGVNTLFTGLAFAGLIYTIVLQRSDLDMQAKELVLTRNEMQRATEAQVGSQKAHTEQVKLLQASARLNVIATLTDNYTRQMETAERIIDAVSIERDLWAFQELPENTDLSVDDARAVFVERYSVANPVAARHFAGWLNARRRRLELLEMLEKAFEEVESARQVEG